MPTTVTVVGQEHIHIHLCNNYKFWSINIQPCTVTMIPTMQHMHWPGGINEYLTALLLVRVSMLYTCMYTGWGTRPEVAHCLYSTDCHSVFCTCLDWVHWPREGSGKNITTLHCPIVYPDWVSRNVTVSTDEGELVWTVPSLELQGDSEDSCEMQNKVRTYVSSTQMSHHFMYNVVHNVVHWGL